MDALLRGSRRNPELLLRFGRNAVHSRTRKPLQPWVKALPGRRFDKDLGGWVVTGIGPTPQQIITDAGFRIIWANDPASDLYDCRNLDDLVTPIAKLHPNKRRTMVRHRFLGFDLAAELLGWGAIWDKKRGLFMVPTIDMLTMEGTLRPGIHHHQDAIDEAIRLRSRVNVAPENVALLSKAGSATSLASLTAEENEQLKRINGVFAPWFGLPMFDFQEIGAYAVAAGHNGLFDEPRVGKALPLTEPVLTPTGFRPMGDLVEGDQVIGSDGVPHNITGVFYQGARDVYRVTFSDGAYVIADGEHLWEVHGSGTRIMTTLDILNSGLQDPTTGDPWQVPVVNPIQFDTELNTDSLLLKPVDVRVNALRFQMNSNGLIWNRGGAAIQVAGPEHARTTIDLIRSLGGVAEHLEGPSEVVFTTPMNPFHESHQLSGLWEQTTPERWITSIEQLAEPVECQCIEVDAPDSLFVTRDYVLTHNTRTSLAAATLLKSHRTLIITPPLVLTNWSVNVEESGLYNRGGKSDGKIAVFKSGRKEPELPETGVVIVSDSLIAAREELKKKIMAWSPQVVIVDEAHREGTYGTKRCEAVLDIAAVAEKMVIPLTGTPIAASPMELTPLLEMSGHLGPIFGGVDGFLKLFCTRDKFGRLHAKKTGQLRLQNLLRDQVWVRRSKAQVGIGTAGTHDKLILDVDLKLFNEAHETVNDEIGEWVDKYVDQMGSLPNDEAIDQFSNENIGLLSILRRAAGMSKIPGAAEMVIDHVKNTIEYLPDGRPIYNRPLIVWTHHRDVTEAMASALDGHVEGSAMIIGGMSQKQKDDVVRRFQAGEIPVLAASIIAAGVGIDLTRSSDAWFVETDWTPMNVLQAMDRIQGVNQKRTTSTLTLVAYGTLDERIQKVQNTKGKTLSAVLGGDHDVSVVDNVEDMKSASDIVRELTVAVVEKKRKKR
ncbi:helicase-related protein [Leifsonia sp. Leaf264]|uniref:helicase-related protein n=1 Tax=Leifsonia sp. Leaf264 TaxID=1736314 RepID=UPI0006F62608|nr:helicase-related protein [Leifsonia sp. Leaf264]KQO98852.1 hypothetical protein ASF30_12380 [Leifsonia sp. Leaf264]